MSNRRVYLHIGAPKTGTTYLQDRLARNTRSLSSHGVTLPTRSPVVSPGLFHFRAALDEADLTEEQRQTFWDYVTHAAQFMVNTFD